MNDKSGLEPINIMLSREELTLVLDLLQVDTLPGLDVDPLGELNEEQRALAQIWAGRALRARGLARLDGDELAVHSTLLTAVGVCAYSHNAIFIYHWPENGEPPTRYFGHIRGDDYASHTRPEDVLHLFTLLPSKEDMLAQVMAVCEYEDGMEIRPLEMTVTNDDFVRARELANAGDVQKATDLLTNNAATTETAAAFAATLASSPRISVLQTLKQGEGEAVQKGDFTLVQNDTYSWFIAPARADDENASLLVKSTTKDEIESLLIGLL